MYFDATAALTSGLSLCIWSKDSMSISARKKWHKSLFGPKREAERDCSRPKNYFFG